MTSYAITDKNGNAAYAAGVAQVMSMRFREFTDAHVVSDVKKDAIVKDQVLVMTVKEIHPKSFEDKYHNGRLLNSDDIICLKYDENQKSVISIATPEEVERYMVSADPNAHKQMDKTRDALRKEVLTGLGLMDEGDPLPPETPAPTVIPTPQPEPNNGMQVSYSFKM